MRVMFRVRVRVGTEYGCRACHPHGPVLAPALGHAALVVAQPVAGALGVRQDVEGCHCGEGEMCGGEREVLQALYDRAAVEEVFVCVCLIVF